MAEGMSVTEIELYFDEKSLARRGKANASVQGGQRGPSYFRRSGLSKAFRRRAETPEGLEKWELIECLGGMSWCEVSRRGRDEVLRGWVGLEAWRTVGVFRLNAPFPNQIPLRYAISW